ncbi:efflux RND transporter periplasmic adaptor subunit [Thiohalorhabdus methylotrophus]|uniref:Efflux RND transporter periplasmic adaptor subunit n=1 Tax=Thiohalorhabdus methylotrophus TaxID=3242694 RepID=A0ABV4TSG9_9GAMM
MRVNSKMLAALALLSGLIAVPAPAVAEDGSHNEGKAGAPQGNEEGASRRVHLNEKQRDRLDLKIAPAELGSAEGALVLPATVHFDQDRVAQVGPRLRAKVVRVTKDLGERVKAGETVVVMDSVALGKAKARYLTAQAAYETAEADYERQQKLQEEQIASEAELLDARARFQEARARRNAAMEELRLYGLARARIRDIEAGGDQPLSRYQLASPLAGVVQRRDLTPGQTVSPEETPIHVVDTGQVWVMIEAYERHLPLLKPGQQVAFRVRALPDHTFSGRTDWTSRQLDKQTRTVRVRAMVDNAGGLLRAGMFGKATLRTSLNGKAAMIPVDAVQTIHGKPMVFLPGQRKGHFRAVPVALGEEADGRVEVLKGLKPGDRFVARGAFDLKSALTASGRSTSHSH